jgi:ferritin-like protein 2
MQLISSELLALFNKKISLEVYNSQIYIKISNYLSNLGLDKIADFFKTQSMGEIDHRNLFIEYLNNRNCNVDILQVDSVIQNINSLQDIAILYVEREFETTKFIKSMVFQAFEEEDLITYDFLITIIKEQQEEEKLSLTFQDMVNNIGTEMSCWQIFNNTFPL